MHRDGHFIEVEANLKKVTDTTVLAIVRDITERLRVQNELMESENRLRTIFETEPECIKLLDIDCKAHELDNLYVADSSFFPSIGAVNPTLTIVANALRVADQIKLRLGA